MKQFVTRFLFAYAFVVLFLVPISVQFGTLREAAILPPVSVAEAQGSELGTVPSEPVQTPVTAVAVSKVESPMSVAEEKSAPAPVRQTMRLSIPAISVSAPVLALGLEPDGKMDVPDNYTEIGWYGPGTKPGDVGTAVMGAHVNSGGFSPKVSGVFEDLDQLALGEEISFTNASGSEVRFRVTEVKVYPYNYPATQEIFGSTGVARLALITCHGEWSPSIKTYKERLVVFAEKI